MLLPLDDSSFNDERRALISIRGALLLLIYYSVYRIVRLDIYSIGPALSLVNSAHRRSVTLNFYPETIMFVSASSEVWRKV